MMRETFGDVFPSQDAAKMTDAYFTHLHDVQFLHRRLIALRTAALRGFVKERVDWTPDAGMALSTQPLVVCGPHWGYYTVAALKLAERFGPRLLIFYNPPELNPFSATMTALLERLDSGTGAVLNDRKGVLRAFRHVKDGGVIAIMPDFASPSSNSLFVPFFGRFYETLPGAATMANKSGAQVATLYCRGDAHGRYAITANRVTAACGSIDDADAAYRLSAAIFADMERVIRPDAPMWAFWDTYLTRSLTGVRVPKTIDELHTVLRAAEATASAFGAAQQNVLREVLPQLARTAAGPSAGSGYSGGAAGGNEISL